MRVSATEAKNRFGALCAQAKREPIFVEKAGAIDTVIVSAEQFAALQKQSLYREAHRRRQALEAVYSEWIDQQNVLVERLGVPGQEFRPW